MRLRRLVLLFALSVSSTQVSVGCSGDSPPHGSQLDATGGTAGTATGGSAGSAGASASGGTGGSGGSISLDGSGGAPEAEAGACQAQAAEFDAACGACLKQNCCTEAAACGDNAECAALLTCIRACPPSDAGTADPCVQTCAGQHPDGFSGYNGLVLCLGNACSMCPY